MKKLELDFSPYTARRRLRMGLFALFLGLLAGVVLLIQQQKLNHLLNDGATARAVSDHADIKADSGLNNAEKQAENVQAALQRPWQAMFDALEQVQSSSRAVHLLSIQPNPARAEIMLTGEVADFSILLGYINKFKDQPQFLDVTLINQRRIKQDNQPGLAFSLVIQWKT